MACLCAPTSHEGSFRCRLHRSSPNPLSNPARSSLNHPIRALNPSTNCACDVAPSQICTITVRESSTSAAVSRASLPLDNRIRTAQAAADRPNILRTCPSALSASDSSSLSSSSAAAGASPWSSTSKSPSCRLSSSSSSSFALTAQLQAPSSSSSSRASASSSSQSPSSPFYCSRPPPAHRPPPSYSSASKSPCRVSSPPAPSPGYGASSTAPSASHAAAMAIMKQHSHNKHGARSYNRNSLGPSSSFKIGPSRLSRMALASTDQELPLLKEEPYANSPRQHGGAPDTFPGSFADSPNVSGFTPFRVAQIGLKTRSAALKLKQSESLCRIVGSKEGSLIMPTVY